MFVSYRIMQKILFFLIFSFSMTVFAEKKEWQDPDLNAINRIPMRAAFFAYSSIETAKKGGKIILSLPIESYYNKKE